MHQLNCLNINISMQYINLVSFLGKLFSMVQLFLGYEKMTWSQCNLGNSLHDLHRLEVRVKTTLKHQAI